MLLPGRRLGRALRVVADLSEGVAGDTFQGAMTATLPPKHPLRGQVCLQVE